MRKVLLTLRNTRNIFTSHLIKKIKMDPAVQFRNLNPTNNFAMGGLPMHFGKVLLREGKPIPKTLFLDIMVEKTQLLIEHIKNHHLGLCLTANIGGNTAVVRLYDNFATVNTQVLHITVSNHSDLEDQLWRLYIEVNGVIHTFMPDDIDEMPPLEDITDDES